MVFILKLKLGGLSLVSSSSRVENFSYSEYFRQITVTSLPSPAMKSPGR